jgi:hypothetical protein
MPVITRFTLLTLTAAGWAFAQDTLVQQNSAPPEPSASAPAQPIGGAPVPANQDEGPNSAGWKGLSVKEKLSYDWRHLFDVDNVVFAAMGAGIDQARDRPEWGEGWGPYGQRFGSHIGYYIVQRSVFFPVQAIDHEDTRYFRSTRTSLKGRLGDAFLHTVWRHNDSGGMMPAYSEFLGDYAAAAVSRQWWPRKYHNGEAIFIAGSNTILVDAGINVLHEFTPDIKRWLHLSH